MSHTPIDQSQQARMVKDTLILAKVNRAHREAFKGRFPAQVEHIMRLTAERLHNILIRKPTDLGDPSTWTCTAGEIRDLSQALQLLTQISKDFPVIEE